MNVCAAGLSPHDLVNLDFWEWKWVDRRQGLEDEDFRYVDLRARYGRWYPLVNLSGIHLFPTLLVPWPWRRS